MLSYGGVLSGGGRVHGGKVKLLHLQERFPEGEDFNVLYLVSSATLPHAIEFVRWAKDSGVKLVWNQNGVAFPAWAGRRVEEFNRPMRELLDEADFIVYQSAFCRDSSERWLGTASCPSAILYNPVAVAEFQPAAEAAVGEPWKLLVAGTHHQRERVTVPLQVVRLFADMGRTVLLTIAGELRWTNGQVEVAELVRELRLSDRVNVVPPFTQSEAVKLYQTHHVLLHLKYHDPCPTVVIEALACGLPVIGSATGGMPELVGDDGGVLIDLPTSYDRSVYPEADAVAGAVERVMENREQARRNARSRAECLFDSRDWVDAHARIFDQLVKQG